MSNVAAFSMISAEDSRAVINCHEGINNIFMTFSNISEVHISGLMFIGCGGSTVNSVNFF